MVSNKMRVCEEMKKFYQDLPDAKYRIPPGLFEIFLCDQIDALKARLDKIEQRLGINEEQ